MNNYPYAIYFSEARHKNSSEYRKSFFSDGFNRFFSYRYASRIVHAIIICEHRYGEIKISRLTDLTDLKRSTIYRYLENCIYFRIIEKNDSGKIIITEEFWQEQDNYSKKVMKELKERYDYIQYNSRYSLENESS